MVFINKIVAATAFMAANSMVSADHEGPLRAKFDNKISKGYFDYYDGFSGGAKYFFKIKIHNATEEVFGDCMSEENGKQYINMNYHIHLGRPDSDLIGGGITSECGATAGSPPVGGHLDPTLACGP